MSAALLVENTSVITITRTQQNKPWHVDVTNASVIESARLRLNFPIRDFATRSQAIALADKMHDMIHGEIHDEEMFDGSHVISMLSLVNHQETETEVDEENDNDTFEKNFDTDDDRHLPLKDTEDKVVHWQSSIPYSAIVRRFKPFSGGISPESLNRHKKKMKT